MEMNYRMNYYWEQVKKKTKSGNAFDNNISTDLKLSEAHNSKLIQSVGFLGSLSSKLAGK